MTPIEAAKAIIEEDGCFETLVKCRDCPIRCSGCNTNIDEEKNILRAKHFLLKLSMEEK